MFYCRVSNHHASVSHRFPLPLKSFSFEGVFVVYDSSLRVVQQGVCGCFFILVLGEIFNLDGLLEGVAIGGSLSLIEKLFELRRYYGERLPGFLRGDFILAFVHLDELEVEIIKSPFSVKNVYYTCNQSGFYFSTSFAFLKKESGCLIQIDADKIIDTLSGGHFLSGQTY